MKRKCRACKHFIRLRNADDDDYWSIQKQGFCLMGEGDGDFSLRISSSISRQECHCFVFDVYNNETLSMEKALRTQLEAFRHKCEDRRTTEYKMIKPMLEAQKEVKDNFFGDKWTADFFRTRRVARLVFQKNHQELYKAINDRISWRKHDYMEFLAEIVFQLHEKYCDCNNIEMVKP